MKKDFKLGSSLWSKDLHIDQVSLEEPLNDLLSVLVKDSLFYSLNTLIWSSHIGIYVLFCYLHRKDLNGQKS